MKSARRLVTAFGTSAAVLLLPTIANAYANRSGYETFRVEFVDGGAHASRVGAIVADLRLRANADGIVNGFERYEGNVGREIELSGSRDGNRITLTSLSGEVVNLNGAFENGKIIGSGYLGDREVDFVATPSDPRSTGAAI